MIREPFKSLLRDLEDARKALAAANAETDRYRAAMVKCTQILQAACRGEGEL